MKDSFIDRTFTLEDHSNIFITVVDELVFYTKDWCRENSLKNATLEQAVTLVKFGLAFDVLDL